MRLLLFTEEHTESAPFLLLFERHFMNIGVFDEDSGQR
jgi:hypothetical protein